MLKIAQAEVVKDGKVIRSAVYEMDVTNKIQVTSAQVDMQIDRLSKELSKWTEIKAQINPVVEEVVKE